MKQNGFTLIEVMVALLVTAILASISVPFYRSFSFNLDLKSTARDVASDLRYAQQLAVTTQINHLVVFNINTNHYSIKNSQTENIIKSISIKNPVTILSITDLPGNTVTFNATGAATSSGVIILTNPNNREATIEIKPSGYVKVQ